MVATDSHLGYMERDPVRGKDSFAAFEEMLLLAKQKKVDFVLLGGDLFHDNKPSRRTLHRTMDILRRHCMGDEPVSFQIISEQGQNFRDRFGHVNYEDPYFSVGLPIFSIHGSHDDPTTEGGVESLAALDLLHVANLVNYFGKTDKVDDVEVNPILIQKGLTKLALYGLGSIRDERLNRMLQKKKVRFLRPLEDDGGKDFFNIFVLHQNRDLGRGKKNSIHESMIPEWMDLVIWGREHECQLEPMESLVGTFRISQPGSSVATSLCEGEGVPKNVGLLEIRGNDFRLQAVPLSQVRPFRMREIVLNEVEGLDSKGVNVDEAVGEALAREVEKMVQELHQEEEKLATEPPEGQEYLVEKRDQVLVRLKVEHSDFPTLNNQRFGSQFMGKVANPADLLLFYRRHNFDGRAAGGSGTAAGGSTSRSRGGLSDPIRPDNLADLRVEDLVMENLETADKKLSLLLEPKLKMALEDFVYKQDTQAIKDLVKDTLEATQKALMAKKAARNAAMIDDAVSKRSENERAKLEAKRVRSSAERSKSRAKRSTAGAAPAGRISGSDAAGGGDGGGSGRRGDIALTDCFIDDYDVVQTAAIPGGGGASGGTRDRTEVGPSVAACPPRERSFVTVSRGRGGGGSGDDEDKILEGSASRRGARSRGASAAWSKKIQSQTKKRKQVAVIDVADSDEGAANDDDHDDFKHHRGRKTTTERGSSKWRGGSKVGAASAASVPSAAKRRRGAAAEGASSASAEGLGGSSAGYAERDDGSEGKRGKINEEGRKMSSEETTATLSQGPSARSRDTGQDTLTPSLGPAPVTYVSRAHAVEFELEAGSLDEELPFEMTISRRLAFVDCRTAESSDSNRERAPFCGDAPTEEYLAMTFVHGPEGVTFPPDKPAKLRFFLGCVDEVALAGDGSDQVVISDDEIERDILEAYRPLSSADGVENWTSLSVYSVVFRRVLGQREVWVETPVYHFSVTANARKIDKAGKNQSYYLADLGGLRWWFKGRSSAPGVRFGNTTQNHYATFTYYPIVEHTEAQSEREFHAEVGAMGVNLGGGKRRQSAPIGGPRPAAGEKITTLVAAGTYEDREMCCDIKEHLQMHVRVGILLDLSGEGVGARGKLQLLDVHKISGNKILVLREPRLRHPAEFPEIDWPCGAEKICSLSA
eukprot:g11888.t1